MIQVARRLHLAFHIGFEAPGISRQTQTSDKRKVVNQVFPVPTQGDRVVNECYANEAGS